MTHYTPSQLLAMRASPLVSSSLTSLAKVRRENQEKTIWNAAYEGEADIVEILLDAGVDVNDIRWA
jgi:hypothetical protein